ncbi:TetR family transcriptional regulator [Pseudarthrobacter enclensis]|uniref:TetR family transcriptional regulator n=1 Tax=Pseudarthrobacter enclensis TaxID=993070 RepID=UPI00343D0921
MPTVEPATRSTGRPVTIDPESVARVAMELFSRDGYENTSMEDIARAAGIGRKSLYRYFATKADLVWGGTEPAVEASVLQLEVGAAGSADDPLSALRQSVVAGAAALPDLAVTRARLRLIGTHRDLLKRSYEALGSQRDVTLEHLQAAGVPAATARYACAAFIGATFQAWLEWAAGNDPDPAPYLEAATAVVRLPQGHGSAGKEQ